MWASQTPDRPVYTDEADASRPGRGAVRSSVQLAQQGEWVCPDGSFDCGDGTCCPFGTYCGAGDYCCTQGSIDCGGDCAPPGYACCAGGGSCPSGSYCGSGGDYCCEDGTVDCGDGCCPRGHLCSDGGCLSLCWECFELLFNSLVSCLNSSALPATCIQQSLAGQSNCVQRVDGGCSGCGPQLAACVQESCAQYGYESTCVARCLEAAVTCSE